MLQKGKTMKTLNDYNFDAGNEPSWFKFAEACTHMNSLDELSDTSEVDDEDCREWELAADEWRFAIATARATLMAENP